MELVDSLDGIRKMKKETFEQFILYGSEGSISVRKCIENEMLLTVFSLPLVVIERCNYIFLVLAIFPVVLYLVFLIKVGKGKAIEGIQCILHHGVFAVSFSLLFGLIGIDILIHLFDGKERNILICVVIGGYVLMIIFCMCIIRKYMRMKNCNGLKKANRNISFTLCALCGVLGMSVAKTFLQVQDIDNQQALETVCIICFFISYVCILGIFNLYKYRYLMKHKEILYIQTNTSIK